MSVISCEELFPGRKGSDGIERKLKHTRVFEVITDDPFDDDYIAGAGDGVTIPRNGDPHPNDPNATMVGITADNSDETPTIWLVVCEYDTELPKSQARESGSYDSSGGSQAGGQGATSSSPGNPLSRDNDPTSRPTRWSVSWEQSQEIATDIVEGKTPNDFDSTIPWDADDLLIHNSATVPFDPPPMIDVAYPVITAVKNYPIGHTILGFNSQLTYMNAVNAAEWYGIAAGKVRVIGMDIIYDEDNSITFGQVTFRFKINRKGWNLHAADRGYQELVDDVLTAIHLPAGTGIKPDDPVFLNGAGLRKATADPIVYLIFGVYEDADFDALGL